MTIGEKAAAKHRLEGLGDGDNPATFERVSSQGTGPSSPLPAQSGWAQDRMSSPGAQPGSAAAAHSHLRNLQTSSGPTVGGTVG